MGAYFLCHASERGNGFFRIRSINANEVKREENEVDDRDEEDFFFADYERARRANRGPPNQIERTLVIADDHAGFRRIEGRPHFASNRHSKNSQSTASPPARDPMEAIPFAPENTVERNVIEDNQHCPESKREGPSHHHSNRLQNGFPE
jgi:hypothetical protein